MKWLKFEVKDIYTEPADDGAFVEREVITELMVEANAAGRAYAEEQAYNGVVTEFDDGEPASLEVSALDAIEAQVTYTAMMTDTLLEV